MRLSMRFIDADPGEDVSRAVKEYDWVKNKARQLSEAGGMIEAIAIAGKNSVEKVALAYRSADGRILERTYLRDEFFRLDSLH